MHIETDDAVMEKLVEVLSAPVAGGIRQMMQSALNACMVADRRAYLGAGPWERTEERKDYANP
ncbi:MAG: hypothetical protein FJ285_07420 [Planctomycetes bacterium]|nr:hypothetical protein [Planctomycetota bacterium]